jgi:hypothetical protein
MSKPATTIDFIPMEDGATLHRDGKRWEFRRNGSFMRQLDQYESGFIEAALLAGQAHASAAASESASAGAGLESLA